MEYSYIFRIIFHNIFWLEEIIFENNIISVELAKVLG